jgi:hypothetical protein
MERRAQINPANLALIWRSPICMRMQQNGYVNILLLFLKIQQFQSIERMKINET